MKINILKYTLVLFLGVALFSCDEEDTDQGYIDSVTLSLSDKKFTVLDSELPITVDFGAETMDVSSVEILVDGITISEGTASDNSYSFTAQRSDIGLDAIGDSQTIYFELSVDGSDKEMYTTLSMVTASSISDPVYEDEDGDDVSDAIYELSSVEKYFTYEVSPKSATVETVVASVKVGAEATYAELWSKTYDDSDLNIGITGADYTAGDTVYVQLVASVGTYTDTVSSSIVISEYLLGDVATDTISVSNPGFDLIAGGEADITSDTCMIEFIHLEKLQGFRTLNGTGAVQITDEDLMDETNLPLLKAAYDSYIAPTAVASSDEFGDVSAGDVFIIKVTRDSKDYYGKLEITEINDTKTSDDDFLSFEYAIEEYDVEN
jgi:hypothetical protein